MSQWERRPLRLAQQHYAALDAYILVDLILKVSEDGMKNGNPVANFIRPLKVVDNGDYKDDIFEEEK
jgi:hypothetical protein